MEANCNEYRIFGDIMLDYYYYY